MTSRSSTTIAKSFQQADQTSQMGNGQQQIIDLDQHHVSLMTLEPGFRYSEENNGPTQRQHIGYVTRGSLNVRDTNGTESQIQAEQVFSIPQGSDFWTDERCEIIGYDYDSTSR